jgi:arylsulfatase B
MSDNGTTAGWIDQDAKYSYYNAGMRGWKGSALDGGHRVPCFWHWPKGGLTGGRDVPLLTAHIDILPTLVDLLGLKKPDGPALDGISLRAPLHGAVEESMSGRTLFVHVQRAFLPPKWEQSAAMTERWRLVDGKELYDITADPGQQSDVAAKHPELVHKLRGDYEAWWKSLEPSMKRTARPVLGGAENPMVLSSHDWLMPGTQPAAWNQKQIQRGDLIQGPWPVEVKQAGTYEITLHRWPPYQDKPMGVKQAHLNIGDGEKSMDVEAEATHASFRMELKAGPAMLEAGFTRPDGKRHGAYFATVRHIGK